MPLTPDDVDRFEASRPRLEAIAYRLLGSAGEAEDAVQETFLRWQAADVDRIEVPEAWLTKVLTNLCLNQLTSARARRETYVGQWLPEPLLAGDPMLGPADTAEQRESVSYAVLTLMERLSPQRARGVRAAGGLRLPAPGDRRHPRHHRGGQPADLPPRQEARRGRQGPRRDRRGRRPADRRGVPGGRHQRADRAARAPAHRRTPSSIGDGGGKVPARAKAFEGAVAVAKFLRGLFKPGEAKRALAGGSPEVYAWTANGDPAVVAVLDGRVVGVMCLEVTAEGIAALRNQVNPDKLERATDAWAAADHGEPLFNAF